MRDIERIQDDVACECEWNDDPPRESQTRLVAYWAESADDADPIETAAIDGMLPAGGVLCLLGRLSRVPYLRRHPRDIEPGSIDHRRATVLALIDGRTSVANLLQSSSMSIAGVLEAVSGLLEAGIIGLRA
jgi:hypothetical protein